MEKGYKNTVNIVPSERQIEWQKTEFYGFVNYGMPVFTGKQYGDGFTPPSVFWPEDMNTDSWCEHAKNAGMKGLVLTCKHYDGFCLWPTKYTDYSVKSSNWLDGNGDLVRMLSDSCKKYSLKFGVYIAPWDRHEKSYGKGKEYDDFFCGLLEELLSDYGELFCVWLDGVCGADENNIQNYDWNRYYALIRKLQPGAVISFRGPDVRWCGNERGVTRANEWSVIPSYLGINEAGVEVQANSRKKLSIFDLDLGSRKAIKKETDFIWYPCEVSVPMRSNWFFEEDDKYSIKTKDKLMKLYYNTVGNNSCLMLGLAPNKRGVLDDVDSQILISLGVELKLYFGFNLLTKSTIDSVSSEYSKIYSCNNVLLDELEACWKPADNDRKPEITFNLTENEYFDKITISENITHGQHVEEFYVSVFDADKKKWKKVFEGETIGYKRIFSVKPGNYSKIKFVFTKFRDFIEISKISVN
ncbi:MAG: alpha-L-fucosidase [Clostridia bacterium]|nr:alpha-L-fucosidase [Clostridia bacterium]